MTSYPPPNVEIVIEDRALPLAELEEFIAEYTVLPGRVNIYNRWGGVAAGDVWVEIAVAIMARDLLRTIGSDVYELVKQYLVSLYHKIRPSGARLYTVGRMALVVKSADGAVTVNFCFPSELTDSDVHAIWRSVEENWERLTEEWSGVARGRHVEEGAHARIDLCLDVESGEWHECQEREWHTGMEL